MSSNPAKSKLETKIERFKKIIVEINEMRLTDKDDIGLIILEKAANAFLERLQVELQAIVFPWPCSLIRNLPADNHVKQTLIAAGIKKTEDIPPTEQELVAKSPAKIGFAVTNALRQISKGNWPFA